ncbi:MAG TPA: DUF6351 family protein, partial [Caulobacteraceae bacterium]|nr:DUF6351 family protein [Caulobacteraceae bacterium]
MKRWIAVLIALAAAAWAADAAAATRSVTALSSRPDRVSGGDVLVRIDQDNDAATPVTLNGVDVTGAFQPASNHSRTGLVSGLKLGANTIVSGGAKLMVHNYPIAGPITSGPHET